MPSILKVTGLEGSTCLEESLKELKEKWQTALPRILG